MGTIDFMEAVRRSKKMIRSGLENSLSPTADGEYMMVAMEPPMARLTLGANLIRKKPAELIAWAMEDSEGFDTAKLGIAHALEMQEELPDEAHDWLVKLLKGEIQRPKAKAGRRHKEWLELLIWMAIQSRVRDGMAATRNDASEPTSACDAVAQALKELGLTPATFEGIKRIWFRMEKRQFPTTEAT